VYFNLEGNKKKMLTVPYGEDSQSAVISYLITEEGEEVLKILGNKLK
jgi:hypothetical protein